VNLQYDAARSTAEAARQTLNEVNAMLAYTQIVSPFSGTVTRQIADEGSMANPGMPILTVEQDGQLEVLASISESEISQASLGAPAEVTVKSVNRTLKAK
jgi:multidrug resistance efflux pump